MERAKLRINRFYWASLKQSVEQNTCLCDVFVVLVFKMKTEHTIIIGDSRGMKEVKDESVHLIITSPPYWQLKDYGSGKQIGFNDSYAN